eukprot:CAMPEP_0196790408 /NCGR_PEP_ID=MMETSP1104-20130614/28201_1 /TAXON_ID=33652 /ORGANISM="Cafeteria sp., Strain Caron Lab Isolate" /LENGTH=99 /DNA_ID=CAMNT_0042160773 /DNA_START=6 /DNA_END=302 /DNA_ORIENTATION=+
MDLREDCWVARHPILTTIGIVILSSVAGAIGAAMTFVVLLGARGDGLTVTLSFHVSQFESSTLTSQRSDNVGFDFWSWFSNPPTPPPTEEQIRVYEGIL